MRRRARRPSRPPGASADHPTTPMSRWDSAGRAPLPGPDVPRLPAPRGRRADGGELSAPLDRRLLHRARAARTLLGVDVALGIAAAVLVLAQATLLARVVARSFDGASLGDVSRDLVVVAVLFVAR